MPDRIADDQFSLQVESPVHAQALADYIRDTGDWLDVVPGIASVVVRFDASRVDGADASRVLASINNDFSFVAPTDGPVIEIPVSYGGDDGPDLADVCAAVGISTADFVELHTSPEYPVEMVGFTPGFAFIGGLQEELRVPRRSEPRQSVPSGSVAIADSRTGLYAMSSPGGWNIVGRTSAPLFDPHRDEPFLVSPGMRVRFTAS